MTETGLELEFAAAGGRRLLLTWRHPVQGTFRGRGTVLVIPPLAEEMNKCRPVLRDMGRALAENGWSFCLPDLSGTGDSEGEFESARVETWLEDLEAIWDHALQRGLQVRCCLALRGGALLASHWLGDSSRSLDRVVLWQPVLSGRQLVNQWLRTRVAASMFDGRDRVTQADLRRALDSGCSVECGGYRVSPAMAWALESLRFESSNLLAEHIHLIEVGEGSEPSPAVQKAAAADARVMTVKVAGEPFWTATEVVRNPELVRVTRDLIGGAAA